MIILNFIYWPEGWYVDEIELGAPNADEIVKKLGTGQNINNDISRLAMETLRYKLWKIFKTYVEEVNL